jgi:murein DD-endopeptidase MepM/ murein hydrolase activator NlpD
MTFLRAGGILAAAALIWGAGASRVPSHEKLALTAIVPGAVVTQPFGCTSLLLEPFDPYCPSRHLHTGVDLAAPSGTDVLAAAGGIAQIGFDAGGAGLYIAVMAGGNMRVLYCHLSKAMASPGERVVPGQVIGRVGSSGLSTGAHLHFEVQVGGRAVDPALWLAS